MSTSFSSASDNVSAGFLKASRIAPWASAGPDAMVLAIPRACNAANCRVTS